MYFDKNESELCRKTEIKTMGGELIKVRHRSMTCSQVYIGLNRIISSGIFRNQVSAGFRTMGGCYYAITVYVLVGVCHGGLLYLIGILGW